MNMKKQTIFTADIPFLKSGSEDTTQDEVKLCAKTGCSELGEYKAPRSSHDVRDYIWFCLEHVREYNKSWNYFEGMDEIGMEDAIRKSTTWERPSWKFGTSTQQKFTRWQDHIDDPLNALGGKTGAQSSAASEPKLTKDEKNAWSVFGLPPSSDQETMKKRYKELAKTHHPDANGGSREAEDRLKTINWAYAVLKTYLNNDLS